MSDYMQGIQDGEALTEAISAETLPVLDASVATATANTYVDLPTAQRYFDRKFKAEAWNAASVINQTKALLCAMDNLSQLIFYGRRFNPMQALQFPRLMPLGMLSFGPDPEQITGSLIAIPYAVQYAQCEEALSILIENCGCSGNDIDRRRMQREGVVSFQMGARRENFAAGVVSDDGVICSKARRYLKGLIRMTAETDFYNQSLVVNSIGYPDGFQ